MNENRDMKIIRSLIKTKNPITIDAIAKEIGVSNRTVRNTLAKVEQKVNNNGLLLQRKPGVGISIEGSEETKLKLIHQMELQSINQYIEPYTPEDRSNYILKKLFMNEEDNTTRTLASELYVSQVTIQKDLTNIQTWLNKFNLKLVRNKHSELKVIGKEKNCRLAIAQLIASTNEYDELKNFLYQNEKIDYKTKEKLVKLMDLKYDYLEIIVSQAEKRLGFNFSDEAFTSLVIHIAISIKRLKEGKDIILSEDVISSIKKNKEYSIAEQIAKDIEKYYKVILPEQEIGYIYFHIIGTKMLRSSIEEIDLDISMKDEKQLAVKIAHEIISIAEKALSLDFSNDSHLLNGLILHLRPTINRLEYGLSLRNPILDEIKENYPDVYGAAWMSNVIFEKYIKKKVLDEEIGYIAMHLAAAVERMKKPLRTLVVCTSGIGTAQLLAVKLEKRFKGIEIKGIKSISCLK
ncbi:transcription antiterminator, partial [Bacillaceae bacterium Marseille-Q3522]|nr:transcription antiterminator [Bacillaceae bacterium Marseille-Q3522]